MLPQYQFVSLLGRGGMGAVFKAVQVTLDRPVAIKVLPVDLVDDEDSQFAERFKNEARTMAKMNHPAIVNVYDFGETKTGLLYIVMEFIDGTDVAQMIATQGKLPEHYALSITAHVSDALNYAHAQGIIHRDIKPANILIDIEGAVKVADFGLAKANDPSQSGITKTNMAMGTPDFVAPEAFISGVPLDGRADLYAIGVMLYQMLTGEIPRGIWTMPSAKLGTDPRFDGIIAKAMQTDREHRYQSAMDLRMDLDTILTLPRAALVAQQQAAADEAARAAQKQRQAASGPQRRPVSPPRQEAPPPVKKKPKVGPVLGVLTSVILVAGLAFVLRPPAEKPAAQPTAQSSSIPKPPNASTQADMPASEAAPTPPPSGSAGFSNFSPAAQWRNELTGTEPWGPAWERVGSEMHVLESRNPTWVFAGQREDAGLRVRFRSRRDDASLNLIQRLNKVGIGPRYVVTVWTKEKLDGALDVLPLKTDGDRRMLAPFKSQPPLGTGTEHTAEFYAIGDRLSFFFDGQLLCEAQDTTFTKGFTSVGASHGIEFISVETAMLDAPSDTPATSTEGVLTFGGHRYQFMREKANWDDAKAKAEGMGGHLATITSAEENQWIKDTFVPLLQANEVILLGAIRDRSTAEWRWLTGEPFGYTAWAQGQPNEHEPLLGVTKGGWADFLKRPENTKNYIVEWDDAGTESMPANTAPVASSTPAMPAAATPATSTSAGNPALPPGWTDLLATADIARDTVQGGWEMREEGLHCEAGGGQEYFKLSHTPPEEYDYLIEFTVINGQIGTVSQLLVVPGHQFALVLGPEFSCLGANLDGRGWSDPERMDGLSRQPGLEPGRRVRAKVEIRRGAARVLIDDEEVINWSGDFNRFELHTRSYNRSHRTELAVACQNAEVVFHRIMVGPPGVNAKLAGQLIASDPRIAQLDSGFKARYEADVENPYRSAVAALNKSYVGNGIAKARAAAQSRGSLKEVVAFDEVKARIERGEGVPDVDEPDAPESLKSLRAIYRGALAKITTGRDAKAAPLYDIYLKALDAYIAELRQAEKMSEVEKVAAFRDDVARQKPESDGLATAPIAVQAPAPSVPAEEPAAPVASTGSTWRRAAEWIVAGRGSAIVIKGGQRIEIKTAEDIPSGRFDFDELTIRGTGSNLRLSDADTAVLNGLRDLRRVLVRAEGLTDAGFAFLTGNADLEFLAIEISSEVTDGLLAHLADAKKLREIRVQGAKKFTGEGMARAPFLDSLQVVAFNDSGISDEGLRALASGGELASLDLSRTSITDTGCAILRDMKSLKSLILQDSAFGDEAAAVVAKLAGLQRLNIQNTKVTEAGLGELSVLKNLTELVVQNGNPQLSSAALVDFQKSMPSCRVH